MILHPANNRARHAQLVGPLRLSSLRATLRSLDGKAQLTDDPIEHSLCRNRSNCGNLQDTVRCGKTATIGSLTCASNILSQIHDSTIHRATIPEKSTTRNFLGQKLFSFCQHDVEIMEQCGSSRALAKPCTSTLASDVKCHFTFNIALDENFWREGGSFLIQTRFLKP